MNRLGLRNNRLKFIKTAGELPITLEEFMDISQILYRKTEGCQHVNGWSGLLPSMLPCTWVIYYDQYLDAKRHASLLSSFYILKNSLYFCVNEVISSQKLVGNLDKMTIANSGRQHRRF
jgi:hypothetical protein